MAGVGTASARRPGPTIVDLALDTDAFDTLVAALRRADEEADAGLIDALSGNRQFTVFAPNNEAFQALLASNPDWEGLEDVPIGLLVDVLQYHVTFGRRESQSILSVSSVPTLNGARIAVDGTVLNDGQANLVVDGLLDVQASNGIVHEIDGVLLPPN